MRRSVNLAGGSGKPRAKTLSASVPLTVGLMTTVSGFGLLAPVVFGATGTWTGYSLNTSTGAITATGTRTDGQVVTLTGTATGADGCVVPWTETMTGVAAPAALGISGTPGAANQGSAYSFTPAASGGTSPYTFALTGSLPAGLSFSTSTGAITGTPTATGTTSGLNITVTDAVGATASLGAFSLVVSASYPLTLTLPASGSPQQGIPDNIGAVFSGSGYSTAYIVLSKAGTDEGTRQQVTTGSPWALVIPQSSGTYVAKAYDALSGGNQIGQTASFTIAASTVSVAGLSSSSRTAFFGDSTMAADATGANPTHTTSGMGTRWITYGHAAVSLPGVTIWPMYRALSAGAAGAESTAFGNGVGGSIDAVVGDQTVAGGTSGNVNATPGFLNRLPRSLMLRPNIVFIQVTVNNIANGRSTANTIADYSTIIDAYTLAGTRVVMVAMRPFPSGTLDSSHQARIDVNNGVKSKVDATTGALWLDFGSVYGSGGSYNTDPSPFTANLISGYHPTNLGERAEADYFASWAAANNLLASGYIHARDSVYTSSDTSVIAYPTFSGTNASVSLATNASGTWANGIRVASGPGTGGTFSTAVGSIETNSDTGGSMQRIDIAPAGSGLQYVTVTLERPTSITSYVGYIVGMMEVDVVTDTEGLITGVMGNATAANSASQTTAYGSSGEAETADSSTTSGGWTGATRKYWLSYSMWCDGTQTKIDPAVKLQLRPSGKSATATVRIRRHQVRKLTTDPRVARGLCKPPTVTLNSGLSFNVALPSTGATPTAIRMWYCPNAGTQSWVWAGDTILTPGQTSANITITGPTTGTAYRVFAAGLTACGTLGSGYGAAYGEGTPSAPVTFTAP